MPQILERIVQADDLVYAVPVHGFGMSHLTQIFIERCGVGYLRFERPLANKVAGAIITGRRYGHGAVYAQLLNNFLLNRMIVVGSGYPPFVHGGKSGEALDDQEGVNSVFEMLHRMVGFSLMLQEAQRISPRHILSPRSKNEREQPAGHPASHSD